MRTPISRLLPAALAVAACAASFPAATLAASAPELRVTVTQGALVGTMDQGARVFRGIPYAEAPVGALRWRAPQPAKGWRGVRDATRFGHNCMQDFPQPFGPWTSEFIADPALGQDEDCLTLNVWTPAQRAKAPLPVLVWIHGGGFGSGAGSIPIYNGASLAKQGAVVVTINYRVGIMGFLAHPALSAESPRHVSGNYGLLDVIESLRWVRANIARFGGDPQRVTIAGQSAGAAAVNDMIVAPDARGLFARGIAQSGSGMGIPTMTLADAEQQGERVRVGSGLASIEALRALSAAQVQALKVPPKALPSGTEGLRLPFGPILDGVVMPVDAGRGDAAVISAVPLLTGYTSDEARSMAPPSVSAVAFVAQVRARYGAFADRLLALYPHANDAEANDSHWLLARDRYMVSLVQWSLARTASSPQPIYAYLFDRVLPGPESARYRSFHTAEVPYVFGVLDQGGRPFGPEDQVVSQLVQGYWLNFMRSGDPNGAALPAWPRFEAKSGKVMLLGDKPGIAWPASSGDRYQALRDYAAAGGLLSMF